MLAHEFFSGKQHCQKGTPRFIASCVEELKRLGFSGCSLIRLDGGNDAEDHFPHFGENYFIAKRNLRQEKREQWLATVCGSTLGSVLLPTIYGFKKKAP